MLAVPTLFSADATVATITAVATTFTSSRLILSPGSFTNILRIRVISSGDRWVGVGI